MLTMTHEIIHAPAVEWLAGRAMNHTSQFGEDGLIQATLQKIGETNRTCFEVGAHDGLFMSNTKLLRDQGWRTLLIECDLAKYGHLILHESAKTQCLLADILVDPLDEILTAALFPPVPDLGVIDIDGQDYWAWHDMTKFSPRVMLVEYAPGEPDKLPPRGAPHTPGHQAGLNPILALGASKGYTALATTICNVLFVRKELI